jgi:uncharacterized protein (TIGR02145 family)
MKSIKHFLLLVAIIAFGACEKESADKPVVSTTPADLITFNTARVGGNVTSAGASDVTDCGVYLGTGATPQTSGQMMSAGSGTIQFTISVSGLTEKTKYYYQAYATNGDGTAFGEILDFTTGGNDGTFTDPRDGKSYSYKIIGTQSWMVKNLDYLPSVSSSATASATESLYYVYGYEGTDVTAAKATANYTTYGALYNWTAAKSACPGGWHLPTDAEWKTLELYLGMSQAEADAEGSRPAGSVGYQIKSDTGWGTGANGSNTSGLSILPGGFTYNGGGFGGQNIWGNIWSSTASDDSMALARILSSSGAGIDRVSHLKLRGFSVRCVKD